MWRTIRTEAVVSAVALIVVIAGSPKALAVLEDKHFDGRWVLVEAPASVPPGLQITIGHGELLGRGPCNGFSSRWTQDDGPVGGIGSTLMACGPGQEIMRAEDAYFGLLGHVTSVSLEHGQLVLSTDDGRLVYDRR